ncbi:MAG TPA: STAS domain-containing protein [Verrucomicrobiae bacterium]|nr:STAS domain-containing protein [Verrucomicrobiae bacterium]
MEFAQVRYADVVVFSVKGRVDHSSAEQFKAGLAPSLVGCAASGYKLLLDLSELEYISSAGLRVLMLAAREVKARDGTLVVCELQPVVREIFEISRFNVVFKVYPTSGSALGELSAAAAAAHAGA